MTRVYVAIGSNLGVPAEHIDNALQRLENHTGISELTVSPWYKTEAIGGPANQPDYTNAACTFLTTLAPFELLSALQAIEHNEGRVRDIRWGPRTLDLDIIWIEGFTSDDPKLTVPHPRAHERAFVLQPLCDLSASFILKGHTLDDLLLGVSDQAIQPI